jgi:hypothetical protein
LSNRPYADAAEPASGGDESLAQSLDLGEAARLLRTGRRWMLVSAWTGLGLMGLLSLGLGAQLAVLFWDGSAGARGEALTWLTAIEGFYLALGMLAIVPPALLLLLVARRARQFVAAPRLAGLPPVFAAQKWLWGTVAGTLFVPLLLIAPALFLAIVLPM